MSETKQIRMSIEIEDNESPSGFRKIGVAATADLDNDKLSQVALLQIRLIAEAIIKRVEQRYAPSQVEARELKSDER